MKTDYKNLTDEELEKKLKDLFISIQSTYGLSSKSAKPENRSKIRREMARIKTEQTRRRKENEKAGNNKY